MPTITSPGPSRSTGSILDSNRIWPTVPRPRYPDSISKLSLTSLLANQDQINNIRTLVAEVERLEGGVSGISKKSANSARATQSRATTSGLTTEEWRDSANHLKLLIASHGGGDFPIPDDNINITAFANLDEFIDELFRHAAEICRILCPTYWNANRNLFAVSAKTPEDLAQTIMAKTWVPRYAELIRQDPLDFTIDGFRKRFFVAAERVCRIENRYQRAHCRHTEENWAVDIDDAVGKGLEPRYDTAVFDFSEVELTPNAKRVFLLRRVLDSMQDVRRSLIPYLGKEAVDTAISEVNKHFNLKETAPIMSLEWKKLMQATAQLPTMNASQREELIDELVEAPKGERKSLRLKLVQGYFATAMGMVSNEGVGRWRAEALLSRLTRTINQAIKDWSAERDIWEPEERSIEIRRKAFLDYQGLGQVVDPDELKILWSRIQRIALGEETVSADDLARLQSQHDNMESAHRDQLGFIQARVLRETKNDPTSKRLIDDMAAAVRKAIFSPTPEDQYDAIAQADVDAAQAEILRCKVSGKIVAKSFAQLAAEYIETLPIDAQSAIYSDLINGGLNVRPMTQQESDIRLRALTANSREMLGADYRILAEFLDIHINPAASPVVIFRLVQEKLATSPGLEVPEYVRQVIDALQQAIYNPASSKIGLDSVLRTIREEPVSDLAIDSQCLNDLCAVNVQRRSDNEVEIFPVRQGAANLHAALNNKKLWHQWLRERGIEVRLEAPLTGGGGKIIMSGDFIKSMSMGEVSEVFMGVVRFLRS